MASKKHDIFWISYADLLTSLFFIVLVLFAITFFKYQNKVEDLKKKLEVFQLVENSLAPLKAKENVFLYDEQYKRFTLTKPVKFQISKTEITPSDVVSYDVQAPYLITAGKELLATIDKLENERKTNDALKDISYIVVISGYASKLGPNPDLNSDYDLSYHRAINLWKFWKANGIDFENEKYKDFIDLQIAGNGWGGIGREKIEINNQRFIIQIIPKTKNID
ncbi:MULTISPECIES: hypothetical protein [unclassified Kaistella]|uniref:hypothetical protein n=1 Tax=unclassified Kaistella TaxID=2762626 RepID=UPI00273757E8|nr:MULTISPECIES: hypothetical protein [unclassified Kaistella]MDP2455145.1 hypothetical protein [Kaistella sp. SH11-4b]MDP2458052.1 hypothetical protein [Kaistella sp. SH40-3]MDP2461019.1 hypothetical protein [Kaistella sp. SH19-2b]